MESDSDDDWSEIWNDDDMMKEMCIGKPEKMKVTLKAETISKDEPVKVLTSLHLNDNKAGMTGLDRDKINAIIMEASKGSRFYENEQRKQKLILSRIEGQKAKMKAITRAQLDDGVRQADAVLSVLDEERNLSRTIVHVDMDAFYAAVEMMDRPDLKDKPMAVGSSNMLSTSNYAARRYGVRAGMPGFIGKKLCPHLIIVPLNFSKYTRVSQTVREVFAHYDTNFCPMSLDEAYLDITDHLKKRITSPEPDRTFVVPKDETYCRCETAETGPNHDGVGTSSRCSVCEKPGHDTGYPPTRCFGLDAWSAVEEMRFRIYCRTTLTASAGIAPNMMLAKVGSDQNKPNGQYMIPPCRQTIMDFMEKLYIRKVGGIGKVTESLLSALDVHTCSDLYRQRALLYHLFSSISFNYFMRIALGVGATRVESDSSRKSISVERTFGTLSCPSAIFDKCRELSEALVEDLRTEQLKGKTVTIKLKTIDFEVRTRAQTLSDYTQDLDVISRTANNLLSTEMKLDPELQLRLMGVRLSNFFTQTSPSKQRGHVTIKDLFSKNHSSAETSVPGDSVTRDDIHARLTSPVIAAAVAGGQAPERGRGRGNGVVIDESISETRDGETTTDSEIYNADTDIEELPLYRSTISTELPDRVTVDNDVKGSSTDESDPNRSDSFFRPTPGCSRINDPNVPEHCDYVCPICSKHIDCPNLAGFNRHIDTCLSKSSLNSTKNSKIKSKVKFRDRQVTLGDSFSFSCSQYNANEAVSETLSDNGAGSSISDTLTKYATSPTQHSVEFVHVMKKKPKEPEPVEEAVTEERLECPICGRVQVVNDLPLFNRHIDTCLSQNQKKKKVKRKGSSQKSQVKKKARK